MKKRRTNLAVVKKAAAQPQPEALDDMAAAFERYAHETFEQRLDRLDRISGQLITLAEQGNIPAHVRERLALLNAAKGIMSTLHYIRKGDDDGDSPEVGSAVRRYSEAFARDADRGGAHPGRDAAAGPDGSDADDGAVPPDAAE